MLLSKLTLTRLSELPDLPPAARRYLASTLESQSRLSRSTERRVPDRPMRSSRHPEILVFDCGGTEKLPGIPVNQPCKSTDPTAERACSLTYDVLEFFLKCFHRNSIDNAGIDLKSSIHFSRGFSNAEWNGSEMIYGDGDGYILLDFTLSPDFVGHEITHGVTQYTAALGNSSESSALNESISDVFGSMFRQWGKGQQVNNADWMIGTDLMGPGAVAHGWKGVRNLLDPKSPDCLSQQPSDYSEYIPNGDPHDNCGIPNRAFAVAAMDYGGFSWQHVGSVWYHSLAGGYMNSATNFSQFAKITLRACKKIFPHDARMLKAIESAWHVVKVL